MMETNSEIIWPKPSGAKDLQLTDTDIKRLMRWALKRLGTDEKDFYSSCRKRELVYARSIIAYFLLSLGVPKKKIAETIKRDRSTVQHLLYWALDYFGEELKPVGGLIYSYELWREERTELNAYYQAKKSRKRGK